MHIRRSWRAHRSLNVLPNQAAEAAAAREEHQ
jgi:hypothetical protein